MYNKVPYKEKMEQGICVNCNKVFNKIQPNQVSCSRKCYSNYKNKQLNRKLIKVKCLNCGKEFEKYNTMKQRLYCSNNCQKELRKIKQPSYNEWQLLREERLEKDNYTCQDCKKHDNYLVHHVIPLALEGSNDVNNLITLCDECHGERHKKIFLDLYKRQYEK
jgi:hypothetical protein